MKRSLDQQDGARKELVAQAAVFDDEAQDRAAKDLRDNGFCVIEIMSAKETQQMQEDLAVLDEKDPMSCPQLDDLVISYETLAFPPFLHFSNLAIARLAPLFNKFMIPRKKNPTDFIFYYGDAGPLLHHRNRIIPSKLPLASTADSPAGSMHPDSGSLLRKDNLVLVLPIKREEKRTFLSGSHLFQKSNTKMAPGLFQTMGGREKMVNVSVQPGQALIYEMSAFHRLLEKSKEEPGCLFASVFFRLLVSDSNPDESYCARFSSALSSYLHYSYISQKNESWAYQWLKKRLVILKAEGRSHEREEFMEKHWDEFITNTDFFLFRVGYNVRHIPPVFQYIFDLGCPKLDKISKDGKITAAEP